MSNLNHQDLLKKYLEGSTSPEENAILETWYMRYEDESLKGTDDQQRIDQLERIRERLVAHSSNRSAARSVQLWPIRKIAAIAAMLLITCTAGLYFMGRQRKEKHVPEISSDIAPGKNGALLTLASGKKIYIGDAAAGAIAQESGVTITKSANGEIIYQVKAGAGNELQYNTLQTRNGEQTQVVLPDLTHVWLNAGSEIRYPSAFSSLKERKIELSGEAYFEVAKDKAHPFIVKTSLQEVRVLGTHFNINSYADEPKIKTTLLEGSVNVSYGAYAVILKPGEQASLKRAAKSKNTAAQITTPADMRIVQADLQDVMAWRNGYFRFDEEPLEGVMRKVARWYNVEISYAPGVQKNILLGGFISRTKNISAVLEMMTRTEDVRFKVEGRKVTVLNYK